MGVRYQLNGCTSLMSFLAEHGRDLDLSFNPKFNLWTAYVQGSWVQSHGEVVFMKQGGFIGNSIMEARAGLAKLFSNAKIRFCEPGSASYVEVYAPACIIDLGDS